MAREKIAEEIVAHIRGWPHSGFRADQSVELEVIEKTLRHCRLCLPAETPAQATEEAPASGPANCCGQF